MLMQAGACRLQVQVKPSGTQEQEAQSRSLYSASYLEKELKKQKCGRKPETDTGMELPSRVNLPGVSLTIQFQEPGQELEIIWKFRVWRF